MSVHVRVNDSDTLAALHKLSGLSQLQIQQSTLGAAGFEAERQIKLTLTESGRHAPGTPTPSAPGSPPSIVTGALRASVKTGRVKSGFHGYSVSVGPTVVYARVQELGSDRLPARPYVAPTMMKKNRIIRQAYVDAYQRLVQTYLGGI